MNGQNKQLIKLLKAQDRAVTLGLLKMLILELKVTREEIDEVFR
jgi:hypothetical protein